jgi:stage V sporulation protein AC
MINKKDYARIVERHSGKSPILKDTLRAFFVGGTICAFGQILRDFFFSLDLNTQQTGTATCIVLIFISSLLTALGIFDKIGKFAGAGTLVPITGFSNAVTSPALEFRTEGLIPGTAAKMFDVAGPVIVFGTLSSVVAGIIYFIFCRG